ncbi:MAG TPA: hypothetical protein VL084_03490 [Thermoanaerobaculia bacterium]|nr:hypothetical protein [Thermoanaerobaculia bacterium]
MVTGVGARTLDSEAARHFKGTPGERVRSSLEAGEMALELFLSTQPPGTSREAARRRLQRAAHHGRRPSRSNDGP